MVSGQNYCREFSRQARYGRYRPGCQNVNDVLCTGARPLFFLDYIATGKINPKIMKNVMKGIIAGCKLAGCALIGGETARCRICTKVKIMIWQVLQSGW